MALLTHDEYPIEQGWKESGDSRSLYFTVGGSTYDTLDQALQRQRQLEGRPLPEPPTKRRKKV